jgi:hypothetical protein
MRLGSGLSPAGVIARKHGIQTFLNVLFLSAVMFVVGCEPGDFGPLLDIPIAPIGKTRSPPFRLYRDYSYNIVIGLDPMKVDPATCAASLSAQNPGIPYPPCHELTPPHGAMSWIVRQGGRVVAQGEIAASGIDVVRGRPNSWAKDKAMGWGMYDGWLGHPGSDYVIEIDVQPSPVNLSQFHPRLAIVKPFT